MLYDDDDFNVDMGLGTLWERSNIVENSVGQVLNVYVYNKQEEYHVLTRYQSLGIFDLLCCSHGYLGMLGKLLESNV